MTLPAPTVRRTIRRPRALDPVPPAGHPGCYWNWERAAWVAWTTVPRPRSPEE